VLDGLATVLRDLPSGARVPMSEVRDRPHRDVSRPRLAEVLGDLGLLRDDSTAAVRALIERVTGELAPGFAGPARQWLLVLLDGGVRTPPIDLAMRPMTDGEIRAIEDLASRRAERLAVALAAEHAARTSTIRHLELDDVDLPNRRITLAGHDQRLGDLAHRAMRTWLGHRRATWPHSPNPHVLISRRTALGTGPVCHEFVRFSLGGSGFSIAVELSRTHRACGPSRPITP
jgi:integrase